MNFLRRVFLIDDTDPYRDQSVDGEWTDTIDHTDRMICLVQMIQSHRSEIKDWNIVSIIYQFMDMPCQEQTRPECPVFSSFFSSSYSIDNNKRKWCCSNPTCPYIHHTHEEISLIHSCLPYRYCLTSSCSECENMGCECHSCIRTRLRDAYQKIQIIEHDQQQLFISYYKISSSTFYEQKRYEEEKYRLSEEIRDLEKRLVS